MDETQGRDIASSPAETDEERRGAEDLDDAVIAADDTGMVRNEADIVAVEEEEGRG